MSSIMQGQNPQPYFSIKTSRDM